jgi:hypothetical protein
MLRPTNGKAKRARSRPGRDKLYSCPYKEMEGARGTRPRLEGTNYRAFVRDLGGSVESVDGQSG